jgi:hypothetical protein
MTKRALLFNVLFLICTSCSNKPNKELNTSAIADTDQFKNIERPTTSVVNTSLDTTLLYATWTSDPDGPHADFVFSKKSFFIVDSDGDGSMPYYLTDKKLKIFYNDFIQEGEIVYLAKDTLKIRWDQAEMDDSYVKWAD